MPKTYATLKNIKDRTLTGASFNPEMGIYDETYPYTANTIISWKGSQYITLNDISPKTEGDLSASPDKDTLNWKKVNPISFHAFPSSSQTFNSTPVQLSIDTIAMNDDFNRITLSNNNLLFNITGKVFIDYEVSTLNTTITRTVTYSYLEKSTDNGNTWNKVENTQIWMYNRTNNQGKDSGSMNIPIIVNSGDLIRIMIVNQDGVNVSTITEGCNISVYNVLGVSGPKGDKGDTGQPGDIVWKGDYDSNLTYNENDAVYYNGSSFVSTVNDNTETPSDTATNWDLLAHKGDQGAGSNINVQENGTSIPNTPHGTLNFSGNVNVTDEGSGIAGIELLQTKHQYMIPIWGEENGGLGNNTYEWAFGNGANTPNNRGIAIYVPSNYICELVAISGTLNAGKATISVEINGNNSGSVDIDTTISRSNTNELSTPINVNNADRINFKTISSSGTSAPNTVTAWLRFIEK